MTFEFERWGSAVFASASQLSRTAGGVTEAAYGGAKPAIMVERDKLVAIVERNLRKAIARYRFTPAVAVAFAGRLDYRRYGWMDDFIPG